MKVLMAENLVWESEVKVGSHHFAELFIQHGAEVFWLSLPWNLGHLLGKGPRHERVVQWNRGRPVRKEGGPLVYCPLTLLPYRNMHLLRGQWLGYNWPRLCLPPFSRTVAAHGFQTVDVLWVTDPRMVGVTKIVDYRVLAYRCVDEFASFRDIPRSVLKLEERLVRKADLVFATSLVLFERLKRLRPDTIYMPNGVNLRDFEASAGHLDVLEGIGRPRVVYTGTLGEWFDTSLLAAVAAKLPGFEFVLVGPLRTDVSNLKSLRNVRILGPRKYSEIPCILSQADVGIIPFKVNTLTRAVDPLKLYEYFAAGLPVVSTPIGNLGASGAPVMLVDTAEAFASMVQEAAGHKDAERYRAFAAQNTWSRRFEMVLECLRGKGVAI